MRSNTHSPLSRWVAGCWTSWAQASWMVLRFSCYDCSNKTQESCWLWEWPVLQKDSITYITWMIITAKDWNHSEYHQNSCISLEQSWQENLGIIELTWAPCCSKRKGDACALHTSTHHSTLCEKLMAGIPIFEPSGNTIGGNCHI